MQNTIAERRTNLQRMRVWVEAMRDAAAAKPDPQAFLAEWHDWLGRRMSELGDGCPRYLAGLTAFDLGEAQVALAQPLAAALEAR
ncbi:MAG TPA: hypothetical protein VKT30_10275 [Caulobacteraceae bacterium]|nr:hypothetical protein [Caulobacteraceae bacterium]